MESSGRRIGYSPVGRLLPQASPWPLDLCHRLPKTSGVVPLGGRHPTSHHALGEEEAAMTSCPECENELDIELDEIEEGDVVACDECGTEYEVVGVEPLELSRVEEELDEDEEDYGDEEEEEE